MRWVLFWSSLWLLGCWGVVGLTLGWMGTGARVMVLLVTTALLLLWPIGRLSWLDTPRPAPGSTAHCRPVAEALVVLILAQFVLWPLSILGRWPLEANLWLSVILLGWMLFAAAWVRLGLLRGSLVRTMIAAGLCLVFFLLPLLALSDRVPLPGLLGASPLLLSWELTRSQLVQVPSNSISVAFGAAAAAWVLVIFALLTIPRSRAIRQDRAVGTVGPNPKK
ncbi:hypothetical protein [Mucisphaera sp.]|uniref:hypothetical protein n=1 Tax=Mucisphaera sp. TaxID=2913024 RepID=UPI003D129955